MNGPATPSAYFGGRVTRGGTLRVNNQEAFAQFLKAFAGQPVEITVSAPLVRRTLQQNAYWHSEPFLKIAMHTGNDVPTIKRALMGACFGWADAAEMEPLRPHTRDLDIETGTFFTNWLVSWALYRFPDMDPIREPEFVSQSEFSPYL